VAREANHDRSPVSSRACLLGPALFSVIFHTDAIIQCSVISLGSQKKIAQCPKSDQLGRRFFARIF
jgi:hypothetical protein